MRTIEEALVGKAGMLTEIAETSNTKQLAKAEKRILTTLRKVGVLQRKPQLLDELYEQGSSRETDAEVITYFRELCNIEALKRLGENRNELPAIKAKLIEEAKNYQKDDQGMIDVSYKAQAEFNQLEKEYGDTVNKMILYNMLETIEEYESLRQTNLIRREKQATIQRANPLMGFIKKHTKNETEGLIKNIEKACEQVGTAQEKVEKKIQNGSFPLYQMPPVVDSVLSSGRFTAGEIKVIQSWISKQKKVAEIWGLLGKAIPIGCAIASFFIPGGTSVLLNFLQSGIAYEKVDFNKYEKLISNLNTAVSEYIIPFQKMKARSFNNIESLDIVLQYDFLISRTATKYHIEKELIQAVLFQEIRFYGLEDFFVDKAFQLGVLEETSTGLGQIYPSTAITALNTYNQLEKHKEINYTIEEIWKNLQAPEYNIDMIGCVLLNKKWELIHDKRKFCTWEYIDSANIDFADILKSYNGSGDLAERYKTVTSRYYNFFKEYNTK